MKILVVSQYYWPEHFQVTEECEDLVQRGHEVTVLTGLPNYPSGKILDDYRRGNNRNQIRNGVNIIRASLIERGNNPVQLALNYHSFAFNASRIIKKFDIDFDVLYVPEISPVTMIKPASLYKQLYQAPLLVYCCDLWPESLKTMLGNRFSFIVKGYGRLSRKLYCSADLIAVQSPAFPEYLYQEHGIEKEKTVFLPQFADDGYLNEDFSKPHKGINFLVMGNMGHAQDIPIILQAAALVAKTRYFTVHFVGEGSFFAEAQKLVDKLDLGAHVVFHGRQPYEAMGNFYAIADACVLTLNGDTWIGTTIPSRLQGYMAAGKPVFAAANGGVSEVINNAQCGVCVAAGDYKGLAELMRSYIDHQGQFKDYGKNGRAFFSEYFTKKQHMDKLESLLRNLYERKANVQR